VTTQTFCSQVFSPPSIPPLPSDGQCSPRLRAIIQFARVEKISLSFLVLSVLVLKLPAFLKIGVNGLPLLSDL